MLAVAPQREREAILASGARWANMSAASLSSIAWAKRYRHSSNNVPAYELFCFQRWLMLISAIKPLHLPEDGALMVLDSDILLFRSPAALLAEVAALPEHGGSHTAWLLGARLSSHVTASLAPAYPPPHLLCAPAAFAPCTPKSSAPWLVFQLPSCAPGNALQIHSPASMRRFGLFIRRLYTAPLQSLAGEIERFGAPARALAALGRRGKAISRRILAAHAANRNLTGDWRVYHHFSDVQAVQAWCTRSAERSLPAERSARCSSLGRPLLRVNAAAPDYAAQAADCTTQYVVTVAPGSHIHYLAAATPTRPPPSEALLQASPRPSPHYNASEAALAWASWLRWPGELQALPLASSERGRLHALCLAHMQGPAAKELFLEEGRSHRRFPRAGRATEAGRGDPLRS